jgi:hypothetical protein
MTSRIQKDGFLSASVCLTRGWFDHRAEPESIGHGTQWRFWVGNHVGALARQWLGAGAALQRTPVDVAIERTSAAVSEGTAAMLFEATFLWKSFVARADALRRTDYGWDILEIKSGKSPAEGEIIDQKYVDDLAYTYCVANGAGLTIERAMLVLINRDYRLEGSEPMFVELDVTARVVERAAEFAVLAGDAPAAELQLVCGKCDYYAADCLGRGITDPLFILPRLSEKRFVELKQYERISRLPADASLTDPQRRIADVIRRGTPSIDTDELAVLRNVQWPVSYLDFEAVMPPFPWFADTSPYETVPFQYSIHRREAPGADCGHHEYLAPFVGDWRLDMTERMLDVLGQSGSIVVYSGYEKGRLKALAVTFPELAERIEAVIERLFDLEIVFKKGYCHPGFAGRTSIKKVLPVMVPELSYERLVVNNGDDALGLFGLIRVGEIAGSEVEAHRAELLTYCKLDTLAMVELHAKAAALIEKSSDSALEG